MAVEKGHPGLANAAGWTPESLGEEEDGVTPITNAQGDPGLVAREEDRLRLSKTSFTEGSRVIEGRFLDGLAHQVPIHLIPRLIAGDLAQGATVEGPPVLIDDCPRPPHESQDPGIAIGTGNIGIETGIEREMQLLLAFLLGSLHLSCHGGEGVYRRRHTLKDLGIESCMTPGTGAKISMIETPTAPSKLILTRRQEREGQNGTGSQ